MPWRGRLSLLFQPAAAVSASCRYGRCLSEPPLRPLSQRAAAVSARLVFKRLAASATEPMPSATPLRVVGSISRFQRIMLGSGISHTELLAMHDDLEWRIVTDAAARNVRLMGAVDARRLAAARNVRRRAQRAQRARRARDERQARRCFRVRPLFQSDAAASE
jgi:hypothetical protein